MNYDHPIEQLVQRTDTRFQLGFATEAKERIPPSDEFVLQPSREGLRVLGRNEESLVPPVEALRDAYGPTLRISPPTVRLIRGVQVQEPVMHVRLQVALRHVDAVRRAMGARDALALEEYSGLRYAVLRYEAPLARLIGLPREIARLTDGTAQHWIALSHYALVPGDPGDGPKRAA